jgi:cell wall/surface repeat protein
MKATLSYKSKRNIIIASVIVVLLAAISTAGYFYIKGNDETARAFTQNEITNELTPGEQTQNNGDQQENQPQNPEQPATPGEQNNNGGEQTNNGQNQNNNQNRPNNNTTNNGSTPNQTTGNVPNQEYVTERTEERTTITKEYSVEWTPESITANASVQNLNIIRPIISANKSADKNAVVPGETITYTITVTNTGNADGKAIVKDTIPEATEFIENSIKINGEDTNYTAQNLEEGITVDVAKQNEQGEAGTVEVEFKVKVSNIFAQYEKASIINQATVNEEKTNEVKNPVIKFEKSANKEKVEVGDTVTYTISIENIGDAEGTVIVKDTIPTGTKLVENSTIKLNGEDTNYTEQILNDGIELKVKSGERLEITFEVEVLSEITEAVKNTAYVNDIPTETIPTQVESLIKFESNGGTSVESMNGYTGDVIENREMPTTTREGYTFEGWYAEPELTNKVETLPEKYPAGTTTYYAKWTANTNTKYTVEHYLQKLNKTDEYDLKETENNLTGTTGELTNAQAKSYDGFTAQPFEQKEIAGDGTTVVKIYYTRNNYQYKIQYWYENEQGTYELLQPETVTGGEVPYGTVIDTFTPKDGDGKYVLDHVDPAKSATDNKTANLVITHEENEDGKILKNILKVYYRLNSFNYRIDYYKETANGEKFITSTGNKQQKLKTQITDAILKADFGANWKNANKPQEGYQDGIVENAEAADYYITIKENNNVIKVVYKLKTNIKYTVKYYFNEDPLKEYEYSDTAKYGQQINSVKDYSDGGWIKDKQKSTSLPYTIKESGNVIKVYYVKPEITVKKTTSVSGVVEPGQNITYTITATNTGYLAGNVTIEDSEPAGTSAANNAKATIKDSTGTKTVELSELEKGITLNVPAKNGNVKGTATVKFTVKVTGEKLKDKTSNLISNTATVNETDETNTVNNTVEKTMKIKENTETIKATNIVLVIDSSGSMDEKMDNDDGILISRCEDANCKKTHRTGWSLFIGSYKYHTKMTTAIDAACRFIDQIYPNQSTNNGTTISVVDFNTDASIVGTMATSYAGAQNLKTAIKKLEANGNTSMGTALNLANTTLTNIPAQYKDNNNVVIFLSDGAPTDGNAYQAAATTLKTGANKATIYTIGFEIDNTGAQVLSAIATGEKYAFLTDMDKLFETFDDISSSIKESTITKQSKGGKLTLTNVDTTKPIKINGVKVELTDKKLNKIDDTTYEIVLSEFSVSELENEISVEYFSK